MTEPTTPQLTEAEVAKMEARLMRITGERLPMALFPNRQRRLLPED